MEKRIQSARHLLDASLGCSFVEGLEHQHMQKKFLNTSKLYLSTCSRDIILLFIEDSASVIVLLDSCIFVCMCFPCQLGSTLFLHALYPSQSNHVSVLVYEARL